MATHRMSLLFGVLFLGGCGAEVAGTAATAAALQASQAQQAREQQRQIEKKLGAALKAEQASASAAGE